MLARVLGKVAHVELLPATAALVAKCLPDGEPPAGDVLDVVRSASSTDDDMGELLHQTFAERRNSAAAGHGATNANRMRHPPSAEVSWLHRVIGILAERSRRGGHPSERHAQYWGRSRDP
jgi:hypothetical protein